MISNFLNLFKLLSKTESEENAYFLNITIPPGIFSKIIEVFFIIYMYPKLFSFKNFDMSFKQFEFDSSIFTKKKKLIFYNLKYFKYVNYLLNEN